MKELFFILLASTSLLCCQKCVYYNEEETKVDKGVHQTELAVQEAEPEKVTEEEKPSIQKVEAPSRQEEEKPIVVPAKQNTFPSTIEEINQTTDSLGTIGRIYLPSISHSVRVFDANVVYNQEYNAQTIVDNVDSAAYFPIGKKNVIGDHNYQGFSKIINLNSGDYLYLKKIDGTINVYQMTNKFIGKNISTDITDLNGVSIQEMDSDIILYTCYSSDTIMVTLWNLI